MQELSDTKERINKINLAMVSKQINDIHQENALKEHIKYINLANFHHLPFKVIKDYYNRIKSNPGYNCKSLTNNGKVLLNPYYPLTGIKKGNLQGFNLIQCANDSLCTIKADGERLFILAACDDLENLNEQTRKQARHEIEQLRPYNFNNSDGFMFWKRYYLHFLVNYDFSQFTALDMYGHKNNSAEQLQADIRRYEELQAEYINNPGLYLDDEPPADLEHLEQYTHNLFYWDI